MRSGGTRNGVRLFKARTAVLYNSRDIWSAIEVHEGDAWKHRMLTVNVTPAPAPAQTK
jgi:hypothetical protein